MPQKKMTLDQQHENLEEELKQLEESGIKSKGNSGDVDPDMDDFWAEQEPKKLTADDSPIVKNFTKYFDLDEE